MKRVGRPRVGLIRFIIAFVLFYFIYKFIRSLLIGKGAQSEHIGRPQKKVLTGEDLVEDPQCHTYIPLSDAYKINHHGKDLFFCSKKCFEEYFVNNNRNG